MGEATTTPKNAAGAVSVTKNGDSESGYVKVPKKWLVVGAVLLLALSADFRTGNMAKNLMVASIAETTKTTITAEEDSVAQHTQHVGMPAVSDDFYKETVRTAAAAGTQPTDSPTNKPTPPPSSPPTTNKPTPPPTENTNKPQQQDETTTPTSLTLAELATLHVLKRHAFYENIDEPQTFWLRGIGHLFLQRSMILLALPPNMDPNVIHTAKIHLGTNDTIDANDLRRINQPKLQQGQNTIKIYNVFDSELFQEGSNVHKLVHYNKTTTPTIMPDTTTTRNSRFRNDCHRLTLWVRVKGPEIFSGMAAVVNATDTKTCYWEFPFHLDVGGTYEIDTKILMWDMHNARAVHESSCEMTRIKDQAVLNHIAQGNLALMGGPFGPGSDGRVMIGNESVAVVENNAVVHQGFKGFKMYSADGSCCQICNRMRPYCVYFTTPPFHLQGAAFASNGCELFYRHDTPDEFILRSHQIPSQPSPRRTMLKNGHEDVPTVNPSNATETLVYGGIPKNDRTSFVHGTPFDTKPTLFLGCGWSNWHSLDFPCYSGDNDDQPYLPMKFIDFATTNSNNNNNDDAQKQLPLCTIQDEAVSFDPYNPPGRWVRLGFNDSTICPTPFTQIWNDKKKMKLTSVNPDYPHCWHRDDFREFGKFCAEMNCRFISKTSTWRSSFHDESQFMGVWRNYNCKYMEYTLAERQECITKRKISSIETKGRSMSEFLEVYLEQLTEGIEFYNETSAMDFKRVIVSTAIFAHRLSQPPAKLRHEILTNKRDFPKVDNRTEIYWTSGQFFSSERDTNCHLGSGVASQGVFEEGLNGDGGLGWKMMNFFDPTAAFTYDTTGQHDGLHIGGPPMRMMLTKLFHHMCSGVLGERGTVV
mmetsp:Transcript_15697/g.44010  ORF Transcript_15697/g.44010 Transcript_15697/m.44010 type:complete len:869 (+) Transcript_15697:70-2676(+)